MLLTAPMRLWLGLASLWIAAPGLGSGIPAFPGAEGFGATTPGGRGGRVLFVTSLDDSGPGSLRAAIETPGPRTILFRVGGIIDLQSRLVVRQPYLTIAGQTAPGDGVCLRGENFAIETHDVIVRFLRVRLGDIHRREDDTITIAGSSRNVILDHCSASWSVDETLSPTDDIADVTVQWSIISESLWHSIHSKGPHGYGSLLRAVGGVSLHHNLWADHDGRNPRFGDNYGAGLPVFDFRNNVMYNYGSYCSGMVDGDIRVNYVDNYIKPGPNSIRARPPIALGSSTPDTRFYVSGNIVEGRDDWSRDNTRLFDRTVVDGHAAFTLFDRPFDAPAVTTQLPRDAYQMILDRAGATVPLRDAVDERAVRQVRENTGKLIDSQAEVGGWPGYRGGVPPPDSDDDGMPDDWERAHGLNPHDPADGNAVQASGYTNLEVYLNDLVRRPLPERGWGHLPDPRRTR